MSKHYIGLVLLTFSALTFANDKCASNALANNPRSVLGCYIAKFEPLTKTLLMIDEKTVIYANSPVTVQTYTLSSQYWPKESKKIWEHKLVIYFPKKVNTSQALLFVNGGTRIPVGTDNPKSAELNFSKIAAETHSVVADLQDVPNQYLTLGNVDRKEDDAVAYTWNQYMNKPGENAYWPLHLPMTKAVIKAMDAVQSVAKKSTIEVDHFVISGASKRGWVTWLAALSDARVNAIVPIVIDVLNTQENIEHIYDSYGQQWPQPAFKDYIAEGIVDKIHTPEFSKLMQIEDPINYISCGKKCDGFRRRLSIPKYIISASGDDFFVPDSLRIYFDKLPGEKQVRVVPNQSHYIDMQTIVEPALLAYYRTIVDSTHRETIDWDDRSGFLTSVTTHNKPASVKLWVAENEEARDFRLNNTGKKYIFTVLPQPSFCEKKVDCEYSIMVNAPQKGWKAYFVEVTFKHKGEDFILTTPTYVIGRKQA